MVNLDVAELRPKIDLEGRFVDFSLLRTTLSVPAIAKDACVELSDPTYEGESRGKCPKCGKQRSLAVNVNTSRFYCFAKDCSFKGGGAIDFFARLNNVSAKEASHLLACAYGITPYSSEPMPEQTEKPNPSVRGGDVESREAGPVKDNELEYVRRKDFDDLKARFERLSSIVWVHMLENDRPGGIASEYDPPLTKHHSTQ